MDQDPFGRVAGIYNSGLKFSTFRQLLNTSLQGHGLSILHLLLSYGIGGLWCTARFTNSGLSFFHLFVLVIICMHMAQYGWAEMWSIMSQKVLWELMQCCRFTFCVGGRGKERRRDLSVIYSDIFPLLSISVRPLNFDWIPSTTFAYLSPSSPHFSWWSGHSSSRSSSPLVTPNLNFPHLKNLVMQRAWASVHNS